MYADEKGDRERAQEIAKEKWRERERERDRQNKSQRERDTERERVWEWSLNFCKSKISPLSCTVIEFRFCFDKFWEIFADVQFPNFKSASKICKTLKVSGGTTFRLVKAIQFWRPGHDLSKYVHRRFTLFWHLRDIYQPIRMLKIQRSVNLRRKYFYKIGSSSAGCRRRK